MGLRIIICGSREFEDYDEFSKAVDYFMCMLENNTDITVLSGHCRGTDLMGERYASEKGYALEIYPAQWKRYRLGAGPKRNAQMIKTADLVIAFSDGGKGTENLVKTARRKGIPIFTHKIHLSDNIL